MGNDFSALLKVRPLDGTMDERISAIESESPHGLKKVAELWRSKGYSLDQLDHAGWVSATVYPEPTQKPEVLTLETAFRTAEAFYLTFGGDTVWVFHPLRWYLFLLEQEWQEAILRACRELADLFDATDGVLTRDESPIIRGFRLGMTYEELLTQGGEIDGEVGSLEEMYDSIDSDGTWDSHGYWRFL